MIKNKKRNIYLGIKLSVLLILLFSLVKTYLYFSEKNKVLIYCNFEKHKTDGDTIIYKTNNIFLKLKIATKNSSEFALSGENSLKINNEEFTNLIELKNIGPDEVYKVTIYRKSGTAGIVIQEATAKQTKVYKFQKFASETTSDGWEKLETQLRTPPNYNENNLKVYLWNPKKDICYFDDLSIEQIEYMEYPIYDSLSSINIFIEDLQFNKLKKNRKKAFEKGILVTDKDSYVNAIVAYEDNLFEGVLRFKGDWLDHLAGDKWSFRVKLEDGSWRNICTFSLQTPASRSYINEWFIHMVFLDNDILTTRYDFIPVNLNGRSLGIYAFEEHFQKQLLEGNLRREAPIVSFSEEILWNRRSIELNSNEDFIFASSVIEPFQQKRVFKDSGLHDKFIIAQNLLGSYKNGELKASEVFDIKQTAKFFAIQTVFGGYHGVVWHNIRFYYNPVTCLIEPIAFDCFSNWGIYNWGFTDIICNFSADKTHILPNYSSFYIDLITDSKFVKEYISQLRHYSDKDIISSYLNKYEDQIKTYENQIKYEFLNYSFDKYVFIEHSKQIGCKIDSFEFNMSRQTYVDSLNSKSLATRNKKNTNDDKRYFGDYVTFYKNPESSLFASISHSYDIEIIGFGDKNSIEQKTSIKILNSEKSNSYSQEISVNVDFSDYKYVFFSCPIHDTIYKARLVQWPAPENNIPRLKIANNSTDISKYINNEKKEVCFSGNIVFDNHVYTPKGYTVIFDAGTIIDITNKSAFIINSNIIINGTEENPVNIYSSDKTANGFTILQSDKKSIVNHTQFDNLSNLDYNGWTLTGAVTFYEADVEFNNCTFTNNHCEDMLNTIRCNFVLNDCTLKNTFGDSHDSDYCTGTLNNCTFTNNGNDAIDFSTSNATITNCTINGAIDKGISVGENTKATIIDVIISDVNIGIASKDLSHAEIDGCTINNATYGFLLLQKKPEFGSATITAKNCKLNNVWTNSLIEKHSTLILNGKEYKGNKTKLKPLFYE